MQTFNQRLTTKSLRFYFGQRDMNRVTWRDSHIQNGMNKLLDTLTDGGNGRKTRWADKFESTKTYLTLRKEVCKTMSLMHPLH